MTPQTSPAMRRLSLLLRWASLSGLAVLGGLLLVLALLPGMLEAAAQQQMPGVTNALDLAVWQYVALWLLAAAALAGPALALICLAHLFGCFARGRALTGTAARAIGRTGSALAGSALVLTLAHPLAGLVLTARNPPGERVLAIALTSNAFGLALFGGLLITIGWAMAEAAAAVEENRGFV